MQDQISFLLGSGFSVHAGYPTAQQLNVKLSNIKADQIYIHTDQSAEFITSDSNRDYWPNEQKEIFVERFISFYNEKILNNMNFDYEQFYDYYQDLQSKNKLSQDEKEFFESLKELNTEYEQYFDNDRFSLLNNFNDTFSQFLAGQLSKYPRFVHYCKPYHPYIRIFLEIFDSYNNSTNIIHIHTLNHDLYMEQLFHSDTFVEGVDDGFELWGSPFYGHHYWQNEERKSYYVKLKYFTNTYDNRYRFYKLHGSVDFYSIMDEKKLIKFIRLPFGVDKNFIYEEYQDNNGKYTYNDKLNSFAPQFLSGTTRKILSYDKPGYFREVFEHFKNNLRNSAKLIIIGYGFRDTKINEIIMENFFNGINKIVIIDPGESFRSLFTDIPLMHIQKGIECITNEDVSKILTY